MVSLGNQDLLGGTGGGYITRVGLIDWFLLRTHRHLWHSYRSPCGTSTGCAATARYELWSISTTRGGGTPGGSWVSFVMGKRRLKFSARNITPSTSPPHIHPRHTISRVSCIAQFSPHMIRRGAPLHCDPNGPISSNGKAWILDRQHTRIPVTVSSFLRRPHPRHVLPLELPTALDSDALGLSREP